MPRTPYAHCIQIQIQSDDQRFYNTVVATLDQINALTLGASLFADFAIANKIIVIAPSVGGNKCTSGGETVFYRLRAALRGSGTMTINHELGVGLVGAANAGWTLEKIGYTLAVGMSPATVRTINNLGPRVTIGQNVRENVGRAIADLIEDAADNNTAVPLNRGLQGEHSLGDHVIRFLRPWLQIGTGGGSRINFNPNSTLSCMGDKMKRRPPAIGLVHELCHAWRNAVGQRLFDDALSCGLDDDEVMTTGFPPYQYEKFSENLFRSVWPTRLDMRENYR